MKSGSRKRKAPRKVNSKRAKIGTRKHSRRSSETAKIKQNESTLTPVSFALLYFNDDFNGCW